MNLVLKEVQLGRVAGPFHKRPIFNLRLSPLGLVPKHDGSMRLIHHLSYPCGTSVNDYIEPRLCSVNYASFDDAVELVSRMGPGALMAKMDVKSAFRLLPVHPEDFSLLGFKVGDYYFFDKCMHMGCSISCAFFEKFSTFLEWVVKSRSGVDFMVHYLDDFFFTGHAETIECELLMQTFTSVCNTLGVPVAVEKTVGPATALTFLGLEIDSVKKQVRIPIDKLYNLRQKLIALKGRKKVTLRELQSVTGILNFCSRAIPVARAFIRRFYDVMSGVSKPTHLIRVTQYIKEDINMWLVFLDLFNGYYSFPDLHWMSNVDLQLFTDSSSTQGCGAYLEPHWCFFGWPDSWENCDIIRDLTCLELLPIVLAFLLWSDRFANKRILLYTDNKALVTILNKKSSKSRRVMHFIRFLVLRAMLDNVQFKAVHVEGAKNEIADAISRRQWARFRHLAPRADEDPARIPDTWTSLILDPKLTVY